MKNRYSKLTRAAAISQRTASQAAFHFIVNRIMLYGIQTQVLTDNRTQVVSKFLELLCAFFGTKHLKTTPYHPQTNRQAESFNKEIITSLRHYFAEQQGDWYLYVQALRYS